MKAFTHTDTREKKGWGILKIISYFFEVVYKKTAESSLASGSFGKLVILCPRKTAQLADSSLLFHADAIPFRMLHG